MLTLTFSSRGHQVTLTSCVRQQLHALSSGACSSYRNRAAVGPVWREGLVSLVWGTVASWPESNKQHNRSCSELLPATLIGGGGLISRHVFLPSFLLLYAVYAHLTPPGLHLSSPRENRTAQLANNSGCDSARGDKNPPQLKFSTPRG